MINNLLKNKLEKLQKELVDERKNLQAIFLRHGDDILHRKKVDILSDYELEQSTLKKYKKNSCEMIDYIVKLDFALRDLMFILWRCD